MNNISKKVYISLGTNMGDLDQNIQEALSRIEQTKDVVLDAHSPVYHTEPQGNPNLQWFQNQVVRVLVKNMTPIQLLDILLSIEHSMGRIRPAAPKKEYEARIIDLDMLLFDKETLRSERLETPHPRMLERAFILIPLNDIEPKLRLPGGLTPKEALEKLSYRLVDNRIYQ